MMKRIFKYAAVICSLFLASFANAGNDSKINSLSPKLLCVREEIVSVEKDAKEHKCSDPSDDADRLAREREARLDINNYDFDFDFDDNDSKESSAAATFAEASSSISQGLSSHISGVFNSISNIASDIAEYVSSPSKPVPVPEQPVVYNNNKEEDPEKMLEESVGTGDLQTFREKFTDFSQLYYTRAVHDKRTNTRVYMRTSLLELCLHSKQPEILAWIILRMQTSGDIAYVQPVEDVMQRGIKFERLFHLDEHNPDLSRLKKTFRDFVKSPEFQKAMKYFERDLDRENRKW